MMWASHRHLWLLVFAVVLAAAPAHAWVETTVESDVATVRIERDGTAVVRHELLLRVRGGPLRHYTLDGVDSDAEPLSDATVTAAKSGDAKPTPLRLERLDDATLRIEIDDPKGLRRGIYLFDLGYRTNLIARDRLTSRGGGWAELRWVGPRFVDGIDSLRVVFRLPRGPEPPFVPDAEGELAAPGDEAFAGLFLSNLRRAAEHDELEVVRPHAAKGEPVVWRVMTSARSFEAFAAAPPEAAAAPAPTKRHSVFRGWALVGAFALAFFYGLLVTLKERAVAAASLMRHATPRPLIPLPVTLRATLAGSALAAAGAVAWLLDRPLGASGLLLAALALATERAPRALPRLRAPGHWLLLKQEDAFLPRRAPLPGRFLDAATLPGCALALLGLGLVAGLVVWLVPRSAYGAVLAGVGATSLLPVFLTAGRWALPPDAGEAPRVLLRWLSRRLARDPSLRVRAWGRVPAGAVDPDELRLLVLPRNPRPGVVAIEVAVEYGLGPAGPVATPCVLVRATDGSESHAALPRSVVWTRGRKPEERVALLRPEPPTRGECLALVGELARTLARSGDSQSKAKRSGGRASSTAKPASVPSPAHAT
jgi:hypothetical protein